MAKRWIALILSHALSVAAQQSVSPANLSRAMAKALADGDLSSVRTTATLIRSALGDKAGVPEVADTYQPIPFGKPMFTPEEAKRSADRCFNAVERRRWWKIGTDPTQLRDPLRMPASVLSGYLAVIRSRLPQADTARARAQAAADFLMWAQEQAGSGGFPFPAARGTSEARAMQVASRFIEKAERAGKLDRIVRNGWLFDDLGDGGLQFDNGECGLAMFEWYALTKDPRHLASARKAADWALRQPLCPNWNYNSFSADLLAKAYAVTGEQKYLDAAVTKATLGVIPGQLPDGPHAGRWADPHNARPAYHYIMMRALIRLAAAMPEHHAAREDVMRSLTLGLRARNSEIIERGAMTLDKSFEALLLANRLFADQPRWLQETRSQEALHALCTLIAEHARHGKTPLAPGEWGLFLETAAARR